MNQDGVLYEVNDEVAQEVLNRMSASVGLPLIVSLTGYLDAGQAGNLAMEHLLATAPHERLVTFDADALVNYREHRPVVTYDSQKFVDYQAPFIAIDLLHDADGAPLLLLHGHEPDFAWERFVTALLALADRFGIKDVVSMHGIPMGVPHTRPVGLTMTATNPDLIDIPAPWFSRVEIPSGVVVLLELRLGDIGRNAVSLSAHVPHYLTQSKYWPASKALVEKLESMLMLRLGSHDLGDIAQVALEEVAKRVDESDEVSSLVSALEQNYDAFVVSHGRGSLLADGAEIPSGDELAAAFEEFLSQQPPEAH